MHKFHLKILTKIKTQFQGLHRAVQNPTAYLQVPSHILLLHQVALAAQVIHLAIHVLLLPDPYL